MGSISSLSVALPCKHTDFLSSVGCSIPVALCISVSPVLFACGRVCSPQSGMKSPIVREKRASSFESIVPLTKDSIDSGCYSGSAAQDINSNCATEAEVRASVFCCIDGS